MAEKPVAQEAFLNNVHYRAGFVGLYSQFKDGRNCDLRLNFTNESDTIFIHKCLADVFFTKVEADVDWDHGRQLYLDLGKFGIQYPIAVRVVEHLYTGVLKFTPAQATSVLMAAAVLGYDELEKCCHKYLQGNSKEGQTLQVSGSSGSVNMKPGPSGTIPTSESRPSPVTVGVSTSTSTEVGVSTSAGPLTMNSLSDFYGRNIECCIPGCSGRPLKGETDFIIHPFPWPLDKRQSWINAIVAVYGMKYYNRASEGRGVCTHHFRKNDYNAANRLKAFSVPSLFKKLEDKPQKPPRTKSSSAETQLTQVIKPHALEGYIRKRNIVAEGVYENRNLPETFNRKEGRKLTTGEENTSTEKSETFFQSKDPDSSCSSVASASEPSVIIKTEPVDDEYYTSSGLTNDSQNLREGVGRDSDSPVVKLEVNEESPSMDSVHQGGGPVSSRGVSTGTGTDFDNDMHDGNIGFETARKRKYPEVYMEHTHSGEEESYHSFMNKNKGGLESAHNQDEFCTEEGKQRKKTKLKVKSPSTLKKRKTKDKTEGNMGDTEDQESQLFGLGLKKKGLESKTNNESPSKKGMRLRERKKKPNQYLDDVYNEYCVEYEGDEVSWENSLKQQKSKNLFVLPIAEKEETIHREAYFPPAAIVPMGCVSRYAQGIVAKQRVVTRTLTDKELRGFKVEKKVYPERKTIFQQFKHTGKQVFMCDPVTKDAVPISQWKNQQDQTSEEIQSRQKSSSPSSQDSESAYDAYIQIGRRPTQQKTLVVCHPKKPVVKPVINSRKGKYFENSDCQKTDKVEFVYSG
ncbi:uncharacterized protein LOC128228172 [Mya arenaria]|uniref:uncharacterized protein LOC128228172 n=1 Tax=Mya arenaria TaxID=6604 RepID=UPI0022E3984D|nr:uncharacterized protein LOC128228172 [Mya arenaria]